MRARARASPASSKLEELYLQGRDVTGTNLIFAVHEHVRFLRWHIRFQVSLCQARCSWICILGATATNSSMSCHGQVKRMKLLSSRGLHQLKCRSNQSGREALHLLTKAPESTDVALKTRPCKHPNPNQRACN